MLLAHKAWEAYLFDLQHISGNDDGHGFQMELQSHWMRFLSPVKKFLTLAEYSSHPSFSADGQSGEDSNYLHDYTTHQPIKSGHIIHIETEHDVNLLLFSKPLLDLQWYLRRITALTAAAFDDKLKVSENGNDVEDPQ